MLRDGFRSISLFMDSSRNLGLLDFSSLLAKFLGDVCLEGFLPIRRVVPGVLDLGEGQGGMRRTRADRGLAFAKYSAVEIGRTLSPLRWPGRTPCGRMSAQLLTAPEPVRSYVPNGAPESSRWKIASACRG